MSLQEYFENTNGLGVLATSDGLGKVNAAIYARPHVLQDGQVAFIMADRLTRANLRSNPGAAYLFKEDGPGYRGERLTLTRLKEENNEEVIQKLRRRTYPPEQEEKVGELYLVHFKVDEERPLLGAGPTA